MKAGLINPYAEVRCTREFAPWPSTEILKVEVKLHASLTSALNGDEWPPSRFGSFTSDIGRIEGRVGPTPRLDVAAKKTFASRIDLQSFCP